MSSVVEYTLRALEESPFGNWKSEVSQHPQTPTFSVRLSHPLSAPITLVFLLETDELDAREANSGLIRSRVESSVEEFEALREAPATIIHPDLLGDLRRTAGAEEWTWETLATLARVLARHGALSDEEAGWLGSAGPARWVALSDI